MLATAEILNSCLGLGTLLDLWREVRDAKGDGVGDFEGAGGGAGAGIGEGNRESNFSVGPREGQEVEDRSMVT